MSKNILGLDLGSNSIGWALLSELDGCPDKIIDIGSRIFTKAVEEKVPTPKNVKRRDMRLGRRVLQRRSRRRLRMMNYLVSLDLLPKSLLDNTQPEIILNELGDPYSLRTKGLDLKLTPFELGRILLHFVARRGFLSTKKQVAGDLVDDPDTVAFLASLDAKPSKDEEGDFKADIAILRKTIIDSGCRTLGEYLHNLVEGLCKRNRSHEGGHLRTDRQMYLEEIETIWAVQAHYFQHLPSNFMQDNEGVKQIIFYQRPLKLRKDRVGKCSLEPKKYRAPMVRLEVQRFRYLQDVNNLQYFERQSEKWFSINDADKEKLKEYFEFNSKITITSLKNILGLDKFTKVNLEAKDFKGNITACEIRSVLGERWDNYSKQEQVGMVEDLLSIKKKSALKNRLTGHWKVDKNEAVQLCLLEFEPSHSSLSLLAINKLLPFLEQGAIFSDARIKAGYGYEKEEFKTTEKLVAPPSTSNPIVNKGMHEVRRLVNAIIKQHGKPDAIRIEMARDLEMNTRRYKENEARQSKNKKENEKAVEAYRKLKLGKYPSYNDKIKYRLWEEQGHLCAYSGDTISLNSVFSANVEIDHILPYKKSLDDSYMNKVVCLTSENRAKGDRTPKDTWGGDTDKWNQITQRIARWKGVESKVNRFFKNDLDLQSRDFISSQLNDTRYISKLAIEYLKQLGCEVTTSKGVTTAWLRHQWGLNNLIGETDKKERTDHRHHAIDAAVIACVDRRLYKQILSWTKNNVQELKIDQPYSTFRVELEEHLKHVIISHATKCKLSGGLHEETGAGYIEKHGGLVYRKTLDPSFTRLNANNIVDENVKNQVIQHLAKYGDDSKQAFASNVTVHHRDQKTAIKRVRVLQSKTTLKKLEQAKFGVRDRSGDIFKWMAYGNMHHVEIIQDKKTEKYQGVFVTMMEASHRAKGIKSHLNPSGWKQSIVRTDHGEEYNFTMALHINDLVSVLKNESEREFYRIQVLDKDGGRLELRFNSKRPFQHVFALSILRLVFFKPRFNCPG
jgi:CRISPR-associated endonuclease Csn1